jgi:hypothetical protein
MRLRPRCLCCLFWRLSNIWLYAHMFLTCSVLYGDELNTALRANPKHMRLDIALSLEQQNAQGGPEYVQVGLCFCGCLCAGHVCIAAPSS